MTLDPSIAHAGIFCAAATAGQFFHALKKWSDGYQWITANPRATVGAIVANLMGMATFVGSGSLDSITAAGTLIAFGLSWGFSADAAANKGSQRIWTDEERAAKNGATP